MCYSICLVYIPVHGIEPFTPDKGILVCGDWHYSIGEQCRINFIVVQLNIDHWYWSAFVYLPSHAAIGFCCGQ